jgi:hypothetical protein
MYVRERSPYCLLHLILISVTGIQPRKGASVVCDEAAQAVDEAEAALDDKLEQYKTKTKCKSLTFWHSAQGQKVSWIS